MVYFPVRKCYYIAKVSLLLVLVVTILGLFEKWRGGKRAASAMDPLEQEYERQILEDEARIIPGLGEGGVAAYLTGEDQKLGEKSEKKLAMNVYLSDRIAYNRTLKDQRNQACARVTYDAELPSTSVILIFHNEPYSVVIRTIWSVINSCRRENPWFQKANYIDRGGRTMKLGYPGQDEASPLVYLKEIILVDDNSTLPELKGKLSHYARTRLPPDLIRILRLPDRVGLTRARLAGARYATGSVLVFLDSHCEAQTDWLRPQLQVLKDRPHTVVMPIIDSIDQSNFFYSTQEDSEFQGLMKARIRGARAARGDVLIFLDAHCEGEYDWMRPMLQRVRDKRDAVVTPIIDVLDQSTFQLEAADIFQVGGFTFTGHFTWIDVSPEEKKRRGSEISPTWSPTMAGGLFAINREYYWELGAYDEQMAGWGGENLEMSFRIWQCGGTLETIPCSRVGHVFRSFHPYSMPANSDTHGINTARMAEVWMDEYAELFYLHRPDLRNNPKIGDVTHRKVLREKLRCKNFQWFLDNIYKDKFVPVRDAFGYGRFRNPATNLCIDTMQREGADHPLGVYQCHPSLQATQYLSLSFAHQLRDEESCAQIQFSRPDSSDNDLQGSKVVMSNCHGTREQKWQLLKATRQIQHMESRLCLDAGYTAGADLVARPCGDAVTQRWEIDYTEENNYKKSNEVESNELEKKLSRLRGQRRKSRALLSYNADKRRHHKKKHQKNKKSKTIKTKNKFILKLIRTLMNYTDEHLEMDIYCKHRQLYPNNTFVRDLVTILNERNIKVINNGRVFERNKVTQLDPKKNDDKKVLNVLDIPQDRASKKRHLQPNVIAPDNVIEQSAIDQPALKHETESPDRPGLNQLPADGNTSVTSLSPRSHRIIIEDFIEMSPTTSTMRKNKKKRKHKHFSSTSTINPEGKGGKGEKGGHLSARSVEEQIGDPLPLPVDSIEDAPMLSEGETNDHVTERDTKHDGKQKKKKHGKHAKSINYETNERERDSLQPIDKESDIEVWDVGKSRFRADDMDSGHDIPKNAQYTGHSTPEPETDDSPEVSHTKRRKHNKISDETGKNETHKREDTDEAGKDRSRKPEVIDNMREIQKPEVVYQKEWLETQTPELLDLIKPELDAEKTVKSIYGSAVNSVRRSHDPEIVLRKHTPEIMKQTVGHRAIDSESDRQTDNDLQKTHEEWSGEITTDSSVKVVMRSNLTFNLGEEFFRWQTNKDNVESEKPLGTRAELPKHAWKISDVTHSSDDVTYSSDIVTHSSNDVTHSSDEVNETDGKDSGDRSNSSSESASSE